MISEFCVFQNVDRIEDVTKPTAFFDTESRILTVSAGWRFKRSTEKEITVYSTITMDFDTNTVIDVSDPKISNYKHDLSDWKWQDPENQTETQNPLSLP